VGVSLVSRGPVSSGKVTVGLCERQVGVSLVSRGPVSSGKVTRASGHGGHESVWMSGGCR